MSDIENSIYDIIVDKTGIDRGLLNREAKLEDLDISSLDFVEIVFAVEEKFDIEVPFNANTKDADFKTLGDIVSVAEKMCDQN